MRASDFSIDYENALPVYAQLREQILRAIGRRALSPSDQLPTVREIAVHLQVNPNTVNRAYIELEREGVLRTARGRGTFVAAAGGKPDAKMRRARLREIARRALGEARSVGFSGIELLRVLAQLTKMKG